MSVRWLPIAWAAVLFLEALTGSAAKGALTPVQKKELAAIRAELLRVRIPVKRELIEEAEKKTDEAEKRLGVLQSDAGLADDDPHLASVRKLLKARRDAVAKTKKKEEEREASKTQKGESGRTAKKGTTPRKTGTAKIHFTAEIAPIFVQHCLGCHGKEGKGGLRLDTFAGMQRGGKNAPLLVEGEPGNSLLIARLTADGPARMPKDADPLSEKECLAIATWIRQGAHFDGPNVDTPLDKLAKETVSAPKKRIRGPVTVMHSTGGETVSFTRDVAPFMVERCLRCHSGNEPKGELSLETFEKLLEGGKSGPVIEPGNLDKSRMWDLVGKQRPFKMPPGEALIKRSHWNALRTWILEGAKFDGNDPRQPLKSLAPTEADKRHAELARTSPQELHEKRKTRGEELWRRALPKEPLERVEKETLLVYGNVPIERLEEVARWGADAIRKAGALFGEPSETVLKGGVAIFVLKDRASFEEFSQVAENREPQPSIHGNARVTAALEDAYVVVENLPDTPAAGVPSARSNLDEQIFAAYLMRSDKKVPDWLVLGTSRSLAAGGAESVAARAPWPQIYRLAGSLEKPEDLFADGSFSPSAARDVGATVVAFLQGSYGKDKFLRFAKKVQGGAPQADAAQEVYGVELRVLARNYLAKAAERARALAN